MDVDNSLLISPQHFNKNVRHDKENMTTPAVLVPASPVAMTKVLAPIVLNRGPDSPFRSETAAPMDISMDDASMVAMIRAEQKMGGFGGGVRRESFPGKHLHTPDVSFNCEESFTGDKTYSSDVTHDEGMSFVYNVRSSTPVSAHETPSPLTVQKTRSDPGEVVEPPSNVPSEPDSKASLPTPTLELEGLDAPPTTAPKLRTNCPRSPLAFRVDNHTEGESGIPSREPKFIPPPRSNPSERAQLKSGPAPSLTGLKSISARAAALRFILPEDSLMEMDSILDVQFPGGVEDEFTAAFARLALGPGGDPQAARPQSAVPGAGGASQEREPTNSGQERSPTAIDRNSQGGVDSTKSDPTPGEASCLCLEDDHTLNLASLGLNGDGNTLLVDMSLEQLRSRSNEVAHGNATSGESSFAIADSSAVEWSTGVVLEAQTPKRTALNPLPHVEDSEIGVEATVKKSRSTNGRVVSDVVVDALRSGRALHRVTNSIPSASDAVRLTNSTHGTDKGLIGTQIWPGSTASLRRTESFTSYSHTSTAEPRQYPGSAVPIQRTRSTMSLRQTSSAISYQPDFMRPQSRTSTVDVDSDDDQPHTPPVFTMSRGSSRRSSIYAAPEVGNPGDNPALYFERPSSVASIYDRPTSAASARPTSAASIRPPSAASIRTSSTRPTSAASSLRSGSVTSSRRVSSDQLQPSPAEDEPMNGMETPIRGGIRKIPPTSTARSAQEAPNARSTKIIPGSSAPRTAGMGPPKALGAKILPGTPGPKNLIGPSTRPTLVGTGSAAKTMSAASGRSIPIMARSGTRSTTSTLRSQSSIQSPAVRLRASTLGLFAPDGGPGVGQEPKKLTHKASSTSISVTPSMTRSLRPPATTSSIRTLGARGTIVSTRAATAGSIASLREMKSKETSN